MYKFRDGINIDKVNWYPLITENPNAFHIVEQYVDRLGPSGWNALSESLNPIAVRLLEQNQDKIFWESICKNTNPDVIPIIEQNLDKMTYKSWFHLSANPSAVELLEKHADKIVWHKFCENTNPAAMPLIEKHLVENPGNLDFLNWSNLSSNPAAISILEKNLDKADWARLSTNPGAIRLIEQNMDKIDWEWLSINPAATHIMEQNIDKVESYFLGGGPLNFGVFLKKYQYVTDKLREMEANPPEAFYMLEKNMLEHQICWRALSMNPRPEAIRILEANQDKIHWDWLSGNPAAIHLLEANPHKINWGWLSGNPAAMHLIDRNPEKIFWQVYCKNPAIIEQISGVERTPEICREEPESILYA